MTTRTIGTLASVAVLALGLGACGSSSKSSSTKSTAASTAAAAPATTATTPANVGAGTVSGAGSTFAAPVYMQWGSQISGLTVNYQAVGSGAGITAIETKTVDFGASDAVLKPADTSALQKVGTPVQIPMFLGAITASYNVSGVKGGLKLDGKTLADIFLGKVKTWNDAELKALNPGVTLPSTPITVIHRSDSSGTTNGFTTYLAAVDPEWKTKVGAGKDVPWPTGTGAKGNAGVAGAIQQTDGAIGYVEQAYALQHSFTVASVKNKAGNYIAPSVASTTAAAQGVKLSKDLGFTISNPTNPKAYPISSGTFIDVYRDGCKAGVPGGSGAVSGVVKFLKYGLGAGQGILPQADYSPLPATISAKSKAAVASLTCNGAAISG